MSDERLMDYACADRIVTIALSRPQKLNAFNKALIRFEELVRGSEAVACPGCGGGKAVKLVSRFAVGAGERPATPAEPGPCGACGAPVRGSCAAE